jgi:putative zinc finger/helix-turn-helix YgiT family protein
MSRLEQGRKPYPWTCGKCREKAVYDGVTDYEGDIEFDNRTYHIHIPNLQTPRCRKCGTVLLDTPANEKITTEFLRVAKLLTPGKIRRYRKRLGISQNDLAKAIGIDEAMVARLEDGLQFPQRTVDNMLRLFFGSPEARELLTKQKLSRVGLVLEPTVKAAG